MLPRFASPAVKLAFPIIFMSRRVRKGCVGGEEGFWHRFPAPSFHENPTDIPDFFSLLSEYRFLFPKYLSLQKRLIAAKA